MEMLKMDWFKKVDFAWVGADACGRVGLFYVPYSAIPSFVLEFYTESDYGAITSFIIDDLNQITESTTTKTWARSESQKGLYVFEYEEESGLYKRVGSPDDSISRERFGVYARLVIELSHTDFKNDAAIKVAA